MVSVGSERRLRPGGQNFASEFRNRIHYWDECQCEFEEWEKSDGVDADAVAGGEVMQVDEEG